MRLAVVAAGFTPGEADQLRRAMGAWRRRGVMEPFRQKMLEGMLSRGYDQDFAERVYEQIQGFGEYGFPESHAASFALLVYCSAWLKYYYPAEFTAALGQADEVYLGPGHRPERLREEERFDTAGVAGRIRASGREARDFPSNAALLDGLSRDTLPAREPARVVVFFSNGSFDGIVGAYAAAAARK